jgi:hypothetical protein
MPVPEVPAFRLVAEPLSAEASRLLAERPEYIDAGIGERHRLGGEPSFLQAEEWPDCPSCGERMTFYAQLDSLPSVEFALADAGLIYVFLCFGCFETAAVLQSG